MSYEELKNPEVSALAMMMFVQKSIEINNRIIGWGHIQCTFLDDYVTLKSFSKHKCEQTIGNLERGEYYQELCVLNNRIQLQFDIPGYLSNLVVGIEMDVESETHNIVTGFTVAEECDPATAVYRNPKDFDILSRSESMIVKYSPTWNETDKFVSCDENWTYKKKSVCVSIWILDEKPVNVRNRGSGPLQCLEIPLIRLKVGELRIGAENGRSGPMFKSKKSMNVVLCDLGELGLTLDNVNGLLKPHEASPTCSIDAKSDINCERGYQLTSEDCETISCGPDAAQLGIGIGIGGIALVAMATVVALFHFKKKRKNDESTEYAHGSPADVPNSDYDYT